MPTCRSLIIGRLEKSGIPEMFSLLVQEAIFYTFNSKSSTLKSCLTEFSLTTCNTFPYLLRLSVSPVRVCLLRQWKPTQLLTTVCKVTSSPIANLIKIWLWFLLLHICRAQKDHTTPRILPKYRKAEWQIFNQGTQISWNRSPTDS